MTDEQNRKVIRVVLLILAMLLLIIPEPSGATKWISGFLFGAIAR